MAIFKILRQKNAYAIFIAILLAMAITGSLSMITLTLTSRIGATTDFQGPDTGAILLQNMASLAIQFVVIELLAQLIVRFVKK
jgi:hypothetical protein